ncbi:hypothetical protein SEA_LEOPARD_4 [Mycobacterium phage Leopard]|nr:hypothetical protein SEA_LEOPARD_4 [Mycobacterium phage Leopard]
MSDNIFHEAIANKPELPKTHDVTNHPHFFQAAIEQERRKQQAARMTRQEMFMNGFIRVEDLDDEELRLGRCREANGRIPVSRTKTEMVPRDLYDEMVAEHARRFDENLRQQLDLALNTMAEVMTDPTAEHKDKMEAAKWFVDRVRGKAIDRVAVHVQKQPWEELLGDVAHVTRAQHEAMKRGEPILDAEVVEAPEDTVAAKAADEPEAWEREPLVDPVAGQHREAQPFIPPEPAPSHVAPATSNPVEEAQLSEKLRAAQEEARRVAEARAARQKLIAQAKQKRRAMKATGGDVLRKLVGEDADAFTRVQDRMSDMAPDTQDSPEREAPPTR